MKIRPVIIIKTIILIALIISLNAILQAYEPTLTNELAMQQMQNYDISNSGILFYSYLRNYNWIGILIIASIMFWKDVVRLINKITKKEKIKYEEKDTD